MNSALTDDKLKQVTAQFAALGDTQSFTPLDSKVVSGITVYRYAVAFKAGASTYTWLYCLDSGGKIAGLFLQPTQ